jgi:hypothetical protein
MMDPCGTAAITIRRNMLATGAAATVFAHFAGAESRSEHVSLEGAEGAHPARGAADPQLHARASADEGVGRAKAARVFV